jgi:hypothetical protein
MHAGTQLTSNAAVQSSLHQQGRGDGTTPAARVKYSISGMKDDGPMPAYHVCIIVMMYCNGGTGTTIVIVIFVFTPFVVADYANCINANYFL